MTSKSNWTGFEFGAPDTASRVAAEVMGLSWTQTDDVDVQADRFGDVQEAASRVLTTPSLTNPNPKRDGIDHEFKSHPDVFWPAARGEKTFEFRKDDRGGYHVGQTVRLRCYDSDRLYHPVEPLDRVITNILRPGEFGLQDGYCILSLASARTSPGDPVRAALEALVKSLDDLIADSEGVAGLHRNGDVATWEELISGGRFEDWFSSLDAARASISVSTPTGEGEETEAQTEAPIYAAFARYVGDANTRASDFRMFATGYHAAAHPQQGGEREGWKLMPRKPTPDMLTAGIDNNPTAWTDGTDLGFAQDVANDVYISMWDAAPTSPSKSSGDVL